MSIRQLLPASSAAIMCLVAVARAQQSPFGNLLIERVQFGAPDPLAVTVSVVALLLMVIAVVVYLLLRERSLRLFEQERAGRVLEESRNTLELTPPEAARLRAFSNLMPTVDPGVMTQSVTVCEKALEKYLQSFQERNPAGAEKELENRVLVTLREKLGFNHLPLEQPLASSRNLSIGQTGTVFPRHGSAPLVHKAHVGHITEFSFVLKYDTDHEGALRIKNGDEIRFAFSRPGDGFYGMALKVLVFDNAGSIEVAHTVSFKRNQLRQFARVELSIPMKYRLLTTADEERSEVRKGEVMEVRMADLSGGGLCFVSEKQLKAGDVVSVSFQLPGDTFSGIAARVLRISLQEGKTKTFFRHHLQFVSIEQRRRDRIVRWVFDKQRQLNQVR